MKEYYYLKGIDKMGPYTLEELKTRGLSNEILVWCEGMADWIKIKDLKEIQEKLEIKPIPPSPPKTPIGLLIKNLGWPRIVTSFIIGIVFFISLFKLNNGLDIFDIYIQYKNLYPAHYYDSGYQGNLKSLNYSSFKIEPNIRYLCGEDAGVCPMGLHQKYYEEKATILIIPSLLIIIFSLVGFILYDVNSSKRKHKYVPNT